MSGYLRDFFCGGCALLSLGITIEEDLHQTRRNTEGGRLQLREDRGQVNQCQVGGAVEDLERSDNGQVATFGEAAAIALIDQYRIRAKLLG